MTTTIPQMQAKRVATGGFQTAYYEAGAGRPVILIHGGGAGADSRSNWEGCFPRFAERMKVYAMDLVGFGSSDTPDSESFTYSQQARTEQLIAFIEALPYNRVSVVGNSMGGATGLGVAMQRPELLENLVLMGSAGLNREISGAALQAIVNYDFTVEGMRRVVAALANPSYVPTPELLEYRFRLSTQPGVRAAYRATMGWVKQQGGLHYDEADIAKVKTRTLVFNGKDDQVCPMPDAYRFLELLENSHGYFLPHCGHWAMIEYPEVFARITLDFLA